MSERAIDASAAPSELIEAAIGDELEALLRPMRGVTVSGTALEHEVPVRDPLAVLSRLLDGVRESGRFEAVAVSDDSGCVVAGAGAWSVCEELAAYAPLMAARPAVVNDTIPTRLDVLARRSEVRRLSVDGIAVFLCGRGGSGSLEVAARECERMLSGGAEPVSATGRLG